MVQTLSDQLSLGIGLREQGKLDEARRHFLALAKDFPDDPQVNYQCAWAHDAMGMEHEAIPFYERAIEKGLSGEDLEGAFIGLGSSYRCMGEHRKSADILRRGAELFPQSRSMKVFLAMALSGMGESNEALAHLLRQLMETTSDKGLSRYRKAILHYAGEFEGKHGPEKSRIPTQGEN